MAETDQQARPELLESLFRQLEGVQVKDLTAKHRAALTEAFELGKASLSTPELYRQFSQAAQVFLDAEGNVSAPTPAFWRDVDTLFEIAQENRVYLMLALISFDHSKPGNRNAEAWQRMYSRPEGRKSFVENYTIPLVERYKESPWFFAIDVGNELVWTWENHKVARNDALDLVARVANAVHARSKVLVCEGEGTGPHGCPHGHPVPGRRGLGVRLSRPGGPVRARGGGGHLGAGDNKLGTARHAPRLRQADRPGPPSSAPPYLSAGPCAARKGASRN